MYNNILVILFSNSVKLLNEIRFYDFSHLKRDHKTSMINDNEILEHFGNF